MERRLEPVERLEQSEGLGLERARGVSEKAGVGRFGGVGVGQRMAEIELRENQPGPQQGAGDRGLAPGQAAAQEEQGEQHGGRCHHPVVAVHANEAEHDAGGDRPVFRRQPGGEQHQRNVQRGLEAEEVEDAAGSRDRGRREHGAGIGRAAPPQDPVAEPAGCRQGESAEIPWPASGMSAPRNPAGRAAG